MGIDPAFGGDDLTGIVVCALLKDDRGYAVLADHSVKSSENWAMAAIEVLDQYAPITGESIDIIVESNKKGDPIRTSIEQAAEIAHINGKRADKGVSIRGHHVSASKAQRATPVAQLYEQGRVLHRPGLDLLEAEMLSFSRTHNKATDGSPDRLDAAVHGLTRLREFKHVVLA